MEDDDFKIYENLLLKRQDELEKCLESLSEVSKPVDLGMPIGRLSRMDAMQQQQLQLETKRQAELSLVQIESALKRINDGTYGICVKCEDDISEKRLNAKPEGMLCIDCQEHNDS